LKKILFITGYEESERYINGFTQIYHSLNDSCGGIDFNFRYLFVTRSRKKFTNTSDKKTAKAFVFLPIAKSEILYAMQKYFIKFKDFNHRNIDTIVFDSDPYSILIHQTIIRIIRPKKIIYRQSDPMFILSSSSLVVKAEKELMKKSDHIAVVNRWIYDKVVDLNINNKVVELPNPMKLSEIGNLERFNIRGFDSHFVYYGKYYINYKLINDVAACNPEHAFIIFGAYESDKLYENNIFFKGFQNLDCILGWLNSSKGLFIPYLDKGHSDMLGVTSKILVAQKLCKPVIATAVNSQLLSYNVTVCSDTKSFSDSIRNVDYLGHPKVPIGKYSEESVCALMKSLILDEN